MPTELIGWVSAAILLATIGRQVYSQWRDGSSGGVSKWLFIGQLAASTGFVVYSWLLANWVFVVTNALMLITALLGEWIYLRNRKRHPVNSD
jgi:MtN3 and saliva related transmembrane protein